MTYIICSTANTGKRVDRVVTGSDTRALNRRANIDPIRIGWRCEYACAVGLASMRIGGWDRTVILASGCDAGPVAAAGVI